MATKTSTAHIQESLLTLEMQRMHDVFHDEMVDETQRCEAVANAVEWLVGMWRDEHLFLQKTALPLLSFCMFETASASKDKEDGVQDEEEAEEIAHGPWALVLRRLVDSMLHEGCVELFVRLTTLEFYAFATVLGESDASIEALSNVFRCFMAVSGRHALCVESLVEACVHRVTSKDSKPQLLVVVDETETLTPSQKASFYVEICRLEAVATVREHAARLLHGLVNYVSTPLDLLPLLIDSSQKIRKIAVSCLIDVGTEKLRDDGDEDIVAETIVDMAKIVSGAHQEKRFASFVSSFFASASTFDEVCRLSLLLDDVGASADPRVREILTRAASSVLKPAMFHDRHQERWLQSLL